MGFFDARRAPAVVKHGLLFRYCPAFANKAGSVTRGRVTFLDGYAGAGCYDDDTPGSPLVMLRSVHKLRDRLDINAVFIEKDLKTYSKLEQVLRHRCAGQPYAALSGDVDQHLDQVMASCRGRALFAFFDPFGPALSRDRLWTLLRQRRLAGMPTDVLLHISVRSVWNFGSRLTKARREGRALSPRDVKLAERLDRFLGGGWWRPEFERAGETPGDAPDGEQGGETSAAIALRVAQQYAEKLAADSGYKTVSMPVRRQPDHAPIFVLSLFTANTQGLWLFADCIGQAGLDWEGAWRKARLTKPARHGTANLLAENTDWVFDRDHYEATNQAAWVALIAHNIDQLLDQHAALVLQHHVADVFGTTLGSGARAKHARLAVKQLYKQGRVDHNGTGDFERARMSRPR
ncbi:three-Cys-motif partner protein TcmP [Amycolatopsis australiensis]|uniref:Three-Cys-motif partner protein n=1 Tax=Amycolatopsis australiensis TaxID=546364 RepID=A0A1K1SS00_9PSEU|nr:three-Cys-motif partner protein TcmP [Amycolatopsis australiensis]SFW87089.1 three-Cys-motif partner protein [Amycolatopsis australiensis]